MEGDGHFPIELFYARDGALFLFDLGFFFLDASTADQLISLDDGFGPNHLFSEPAKSMTLLYLLDLMRAATGFLSFRHFYLSLTTLISWVNMLHHPSFYPFREKLRMPLWHSVFSLFFLKLSRIWDLVSTKFLRRYFFFSEDAFLDQSHVVPFIRAPLKKKKKKNLHAFRGHVGTFSLSLFLEGRHFPLWASFAWDDPICLRFELPWSICIWKLLFGFLSSLTSVRCFPDSPLW